VLKPALAIPPTEIVGAVEEIAVSENVATLESPVADAVMVTVPAVAPSVAIALAVPSFNVMADDGATVAAPAGFTVKLTTTPGSGAPVVSTTFTTSGAATFVPVVPL
jgi:hypothetical protein